MADRYFVAYFPYTDTICRTGKLVGETLKYYKVQSGSGAIYLINKDTGYLRGSDIKYHEMSEEELFSIIQKQKLLKFMNKINFKKLSLHQLERIKIIMEEDNEIQSTD